MRAEPIELTASDGVTLRGQYWPGDDSWVLLLHEQGKDLDCWQPLVPALNERGYSLLMVDLRGHGASDGEWTPEPAGDDLISIVKFARERGAQRLALIGARTSVQAGLLNSHAQEFFALVALSPDTEGELSAEEFRGGAVPKLFIVGSLDAQAVAAEEKIRDRMIGWTVLLRLPSEAQGSALLGGQWQLHIQENILAFLDEHRYRSGGKPSSFVQPETLFRRMPVSEQLPNEPEVPSSQAAGAQDDQ